MKLTLQKILSVFKKNKVVENEEVKDMRDLIPTDFLNIVFDSILNKDAISRYKKIGNFQLKNCYFCAATLCLDVEFTNNGEYVRDTITITSNNAFGFFVTKCKRSFLSQEEIEKMDKIRLLKNN